MTTTEKNAAITVALAAAIRSGMDVRQAFDDVFGPGGYDRVAGIVYDELRKVQGLDR
jgi:hypothetical protein